MIVDAPLLSVENLTTYLFADTGTVRAVEEVSLEIGRGEAVALVGESGCGKSMTALSLMRLVRPPGKILGGRVAFDGVSLLDLREDEMRALRGGRIAMIFQDPMTFLNPLMRVGDQIAEAVRLHQGLGARAAWTAAREALALVRIPAPDTVIEYYPHQLSGGMRQRVLIAMAISSRPVLLIADEPTTALDVTVQAQIMELLGDIRRDLGSAMLLITHDLGLVAEFCDRIYVMYAGQIVESADVERLFASPQHPYTRALLKSTLGADVRVDAFESIGGQPPDLARPPAGCRFHPRCPEAVKRCATDEPPVCQPAPGRQARCWLLVEDAG